MFKHVMSWNHRVTVLGVVCGVFIYFFNLFISEIHSPFSKKSEDLYVTEKLKDITLNIARNSMLHYIPCFTNCILA